MATKECRVCGKDYECCHSRRAIGVFNWQEVACSAECGTEYLRRVNESRGIVDKPVKTKKTSVRKTAVEVEPSNIDDIFVTDKEQPPKTVEDEIIAEIYDTTGYFMP